MRKIQTILEIWTNSPLSSCHYASLSPIYVKYSNIFDHILICIGNKYTALDVLSTDWHVGWYLLALLFQLLANNFNVFVLGGVYSTNTWSYIGSIKASDLARLSSVQWSVISFIYLLPLSQALQFYITWRYWGTTVVHWTEWRHTCGVSSAVSCCTIACT